MERKQISIIIIVCLTLICFSGCRRDAVPDEEIQTVGPEVVTVVSHLTSGTINPTDDIMIRFVNPVVEADSVGQSIDSSVFSVTPKISGTTIWESRQTLVLRPSDPLILRGEYSGQVNLAAIDDGFKGMVPLPIKFQVSGREIASFSSDFELGVSDNPEILVLKGTLALTVPIDLELLERAATLRVAGQKVELNWDQAEDENVYTFISSEFDRGNEPSQVLLKIGSKGTGLGNDFSKQLKLFPLGDFRILEVTKLEGSETPGVQVKFSDQLDPGQDYRGLVRFNPDLPVQMKAFGNKLNISADFLYGKSYMLLVNAVKSRWGIKLSKEVTYSIDFQDMKPQFSFIQDGVFLPTVNRKKIGFKTVNLQNVRLEIKKVYESNLGQFLQTESLQGKRGRDTSFNEYEVQRVGLTVAEQVLSIGTEKNRWLIHELNLADLIPDQEKGIFLIKLFFEKKDMLYQSPTPQVQNYYGDQYYSNPDSPGYVWARGRIYKPVILSDIALTYKRAFDQHLVVASNILDAQPLMNVNISLKNFQNQVLAQGSTDGDGKIEFSSLKGDVFFVEGEVDGQRSVIKTEDMAWNLSSFDTQGVNVPGKGTQIYAYTERGVYRPGDDINLSLIVRNRDGTFPDNHPISLELINPRGQILLKRTGAQATDGFYHFALKTKADDLTGNWRIKMTVAGQNFSHPLKIETVVPNRLKVRVEAEKTRLYSQDRSLNLELSSQYLFGAPAAGLAAELDVSITKRVVTTPSFPGYFFSNESIDFKSIEVPVFKGQLDQNGESKITWNLPQLKSAPSALEARIAARVFEKGGRPTRGGLNLKVEPFSHYVGLEKPKFKYGYGQVGSPLQINSVVIEPDGQAVAGRTLTYRVFKNSRYWWWEYDSIKDFRLRFKQDTLTKKIKEGQIVSQTKPVTIVFQPEQKGEYLIEVQDEGDQGHVSAFFFRAYYWGDAPDDIDSAGLLELQSNQEKYAPGDTAKIHFPAPEDATIILTLEKANQILESRLIKLNKTAGEDAEIAIPVTEEMIPNVYASISLIQPHEQTGNDRPIRMYGVIPLMVEDASTRQGIQIKMKEELAPNETFTIELQTVDRRPSQLSVAVVDEGLLDLTGFPTPDPWKAFFRKQRLGVRTFDLFSQVIGANRGDIFRVFSIGGDLAQAAYRELQLEPGKVRRFEPVSLFAGPIQTDENGRATVQFKMPDYVGSVRVMVVSANKNRYGNQEKTVPVKSPLMILPTLPRVIGPQDRFILPVTVFATEERIKKVSISLTIEGPIEVVGETEKNLRFDQNSGMQEIDTFFDIRVKPAVGEARFVIRAKGAGFQAQNVTTLAVRSNSPHIYSTSRHEVKPGEQIKITIPDRGVAGTNRAVLSVLRRAKLNIRHRLAFLVRYPFGCLEQTVSSVFPQLYLKDFVKVSGEGESVIDDNINAAIQRLRRFKLPSGAFSYWPGGRTSSAWSANYAGHFLLEAQKLGYRIPADIFSQWLRYQKSQSLLTTDPLIVQVYRVFLLAKAGEPSIGAMNLIKENHLAKMGNPGRWLLGAAYHLSGMETVARRIVGGSKLSVNNYNELGGTYGSWLRDKSVMLEAATLLEEWNQADQLYDEIHAELSADTWYSTQTIGYSLLALGKYMQANSGQFRQENPTLSGSIKLPGKTRTTFKTESVAHSVDIDEGFGKEVEVSIADTTNLERVYVILEWEGVPLQPDVRDESRNLWLQVNYMDEDGYSIDPTSIRQGQTFWAHFRVGTGYTGRRTLDEMALVQLLPSGWEIENRRLFQDNQPQWSKKWNLNQEEYLDIRDDRIIWFFDMPTGRRSFDFMVKLIAVTSGQFTLPPTVFEAMYSREFRAVKSGRKVRVLKK